MAIYWVHQGHEAEHFAWSTQQVFDLYEHGRGFEERSHAHTALYHSPTAQYRDEDPVPLELALDHRYAGLVSLHLDRAEGVKHPQFEEWFATEAAFNAVYGKSDREAHEDADSNTSKVERLVVREITFVS